MAAQPADAQVGRGTVKVSWQAVIARVETMRKHLKAQHPDWFPALRVYGVPRGGAPVAALLGIPVDKPHEAQVIVDDIEDSGATRKRYERLYPDKPFYAAFRNEGQWLHFPWEEEEATASLNDAVRRILQYIGEDVKREGLRDTPARVSRAWLQLTEGYNQDPALILSRTFEETYDQMVVVRDIEFWSCCEHHLLPFHGHVTVGYLPNGRVVGLSKVARLVRIYSRRLQVQERLTQQIALAIEEHLKPIGVGCIVRATHSCMAMRGVQTSAPTVTSCLLGAVRDTAREEFLSLAGYGHDR